MRKTVSAILLFCLLVYIGGYQLVLAIYQQELKTEMKAYLNTNKSSQYGSRFQFALQNGQVQDARFSWEEENLEFRYQNDLYDIVSLEKKGDQLYIVCLKDTDENQLEAQLKKIHQNNKPGAAKSGIHNLKFFSVFLSPQYVEGQFLHAPEPTHRACYVWALTSQYGDLALPPPKMLV